MGLIGVIIILILLGILLGLVNKYCGPVDSPVYIERKFLMLINIVAIVGAVVWLLFLSGVLPLANANIPFPRIK